MLLKCPYFSRGRIHDSQIRYVIGKVHIKSVNTEFSIFLIGNKKRVWNGLLKWLHMNVVFSEENISLLQARCRKFKPLPQMQYLSKAALEFESAILAKSL